jgi:hypothetical protein
VLNSSCRQPSRTARWPQRFLWAWERPEKLGFIDAKTTGVAYLAQTILLKGDKTLARPRLQPLEAPPGATLLAVTRIEADRDEPPALSAAQRSEVVAALLKSANKTGLAGVQIDFDATSSQREFYRALLIEVRQKLPPELALTMTALASWCAGDNWLAGLPVDEAVPMLFRLGVERENFRNVKDFAAPLCRSSYGVSLDEPLPDLDKTRRIYYFNPQSWTPEKVSQVLLPKP